MRLKSLITKSRPDVPPESTEPEHPAAQTPDVMPKITHARPADRLSRPAIVPAGEERANPPAKPAKPSNDPSNPPPMTEAGRQASPSEIEIGSPEAGLDISSGHAAGPRVPDAEFDPASDPELNFDDLWGADENSRWNNPDAPAEDDRLIPGTDRTPLPRQNQSSRHNKYAANELTTTEASRTYPEGSRGHALRNAKVDRVVPLGGGINDTVLLDLEDGSSAVFKPEDGESPGARGSVQGMYYRREVAASDVAALLGLDDIVPATVSRVVGGRAGSLQSFAEGALPASDFSREERFDGEEDSMRAAAFDFLIGNTDRHANNWLLKDGKLVLIDHGLSFPNGEEGDWSNADITIENVNRRRSSYVRLVTHDWKDKWSAIEKVMENQGFADEEIDFLKFRFDILTSPGTTFEDLELDNAVMKFRKARGLDYDPNGGRR